jgi:O-antigen/teichoic acid export membrane protein
LSITVLLVAVVRATASALGQDLFRAPLSTLQAEKTRILSFLRSTYLTGLGSSLSADADLLVLGLFRSQAEVGAYRLARQFITAIWAITDPIASAVYPEVVRQWLRARANFDRFAARLSLLLGLGGLLVVGSAFVVVPWLIQASAGTGFSESGTLFRIMVLLTLPWITLLWLPFAYYAASRPGIVLASSTTSVGVGWLLYFALVPWWGGFGAAVGYGVSVSAHPLLLLIGYSRVLPRSLRYSRS